MNEFEWDSSYPIQCPPYEAQERDILTAYRFVKVKQLTENEFLPNNKTIKKIDYGDCQLWGVSFFDSIANLEQFRNKVAVFRKKNWTYAEGSIKKEFGRLIIMNGGHINLWRYKSIVIHTSFRIV